MSAMVSMRGLLSRDLMPVGGVAVTRDTVNHWLLDSMCCDGYHVPRAYNCLQPLCVPAAFPRQLLPGTSVTNLTHPPPPTAHQRPFSTALFTCFPPSLSPVLLTHLILSVCSREFLRLHRAHQLRQRVDLVDQIIRLVAERPRHDCHRQRAVEAGTHDEG
jgi:hypothetical protein